MPKKVSGVARVVMFDILDMFDMTGQLRRR